MTDSGSRTPDPCKQSEKSLPAAPCGSAFAAAAAVCLAAMLLRGPVTCVGPMAENIVAAFGVSYSQYGTLAALPIAAFGIFSFFAAALGKFLGLKNAAFAALVILFAGAAARLIFNWNLFLAASLVTGAGIALLNVIMPVAVKKWFGGRAAAMMGLYTGLIGLSGAVGGLTSVPLLNAFGGIRGPLLFWAAAAAAAALAWLILAPAKSVQQAHPDAVPTAAPSGSEAKSQERETTFLELLKSPTAVALVFVMGLQSLLVYTVGAWLAAFLSAGGMAADEAGFWFFVFLASGLPASMLTPAFMRAVKSEAAAAVILGVLYLAGIAGWMAGGAWLLPASISAGISQGSMLSVALLLMARKSQNAGQMLAISALSQGLGYIGAGFGPLVFGVVLEAAHGWGAPFALTALAVVFWTAAGVAASRRRTLL